jgi:hypothetical protein
MRVRDTNGTLAMMILRTCGQFEIPYAVAFFTSFQP